MVKKQHTILKPRHEAFARRYAEMGNATEAYIVAGFSSRGAESSASRLLRRPKVAARVAEIRSEIAKALAENAKVLLRPDVDRKQRILEALEILAFSDITNYEIKVDGSVTLKEGVPDELSRAIESIQVERRLLPDGSTETRTRLKLWSKLSAIKMLAEHEQLFGHQTETSTGDDRRQVFILFGREIWL